MSVSTYSGLGTFSFPVTTTGPTNVKGKITLPTLSLGAPSNSQVVVTVNVNGGGAIYTGPSGAEGFETGYYGTAGDTLNVVLSSGAAGDQGIHKVKSTISVY